MVVYYKDKTLGKTSISFLLQCLVSEGSLRTAVL